MYLHTQRLYVYIRMGLHVYLHMQVHMITFVCTSTHLKNDMNQATWFSVCNSHTTIPSSVFPAAGDDSLQATQVPKRGLGGDGLTAAPPQVVGLDDDTIHGM